MSAIDEAVTKIGKKFFKVRLCKHNKKGRVFMLYLNQSYNYAVRKRFHNNEPLKCSIDTISPDFYERHHKNKVNTKYYYIPVKDLTKVYGKAWLKLDIPRVRLSGKVKSINSKYLPVIEEYVSSNKLSQSSIIKNIRSVYKGPIIENDRKAIKPYELDIYLPELNLAIEYNSIEYHAIRSVGNTYYHIKKSMRCRRIGIRLIHIYEFENYATQIRLLQSLILGKDQYPKTDFNKNNLIEQIPKPTIIYRDKQFIIYGAGKLVKN